MDYKKLMECPYCGSPLKTNFDYTGIRCCNENCISYKVSLASTLSAKPVVVSEVDTVLASLKGKEISLYTYISAFCEANLLDAAYMACYLTKANSIEELSSMLLDFLEDRFVISVCPSLISFELWLKVNKQMLKKYESLVLMQNVTGANIVCVDSNSYEDLDASGNRYPSISIISQLLHYGFLDPCNVVGIMVSKKLGLEAACLLGSMQVLLNNLGDLGKVKVILY